MGWSYTFAPAKTEQGLSFGHARPFFDRVVSAMALGEVCDLTISEHEEKRTLAQNRMLWGTVYDQLLDGIGDAVGYDKHDKAGKEQMHEGLLCLYGGTVIEPITKREVAKVRSSKMTVAEFTAYVEWIARYAAQEHGVVIALPGEAA